MVAIVPPQLGREVGLLASSLLGFVGLMVWGGYLLLRHTGSWGAAALGILVSFFVGAGLLRLCYHRSAAIGVALSALGGAIAAGEVSYYFAGAPKYAPYGVLSIAGGAAVGIAAVLAIICVRQGVRVWRHKGK
ncbi:hypothetical protein JCM17478_36180 [Thermopirellula anaerolimosa]